MVPSRWDARWRELLKQSQPHACKSVALHMVLSRLRSEVAERAGNEAALCEAATELHSFCAQNESILARDLLALFGEPPAEPEPRKPAPQREPDASVIVLALEGGTQISIRLTRGRSGEPQSSPPRPIHRADAR
jgi:hypothetical protein